MRYDEGDRRDLMEVASYTSLLMGESQLYKLLHGIFDRDAVVSPVHRFLAHCVAAGRAHDEALAPPLVVTTNYDDAVERAFDAVGEPYDVVAYVAHGELSGTFVHIGPTGLRQPVTHSTEGDLRPDERTVILKIHGSVDRADPERDSFVVAEEQYIEYLLTDVWEAIPGQLVERMRNSHWLFLGYAMRDWNLLVLLHRLGVFPLKWKSFAVQLRPSELERKRWDVRDIELLDMELADYVEWAEGAFAARLDSA